MSDPKPFQYQPSPHERRHAPDGYVDYQSYRPWLRDEFSFRCVYCLLREQWSRVTGQFDLDHFVPQLEVHDQPREYENLVYSCHTCNLRKQDKPLPQAHLTDESVRVYEDGRIVGLTPEGERIIKLLYLNSPQTIEWRRLWIRTVQLAEQHDPDLFEQLLGYPEDLPDLSKLQPPLNRRPEGIEESCSARRQRGELPATYAY